MAQEDYAIANASGATVRADINNHLAAIVSQNSGATAPSTTFAHMYWLDTSTNILKQRNGANTAWVDVMQIDQTNNLAFLPQLTTRGDLLIRAANGQTRLAKGSKNLLLGAGADDPGYFGGYAAKTGAYTVVAGDLAKHIEATSGTWTLALTAAATLGAAHFFWFTNSGSGTVTIDPNSTETIDGVTTLAVEQGESYLIFCDGSGFRTIGGGKAAALSKAPYESANQAITTSGTLTLAHGLGVEPQIVMLVLECTTAEFNYSVGDRMIVNLSMTGFNNGQDVGVEIDSTNVTVRFGDGAGTAPVGKIFSLPNKTTRARAVLTNANWELIVRAFA